MVGRKGVDIAPCPPPKYATALTPLLDTTSVYPISPTHMHTEQLY